MSASSNNPPTDVENIQNSPPDASEEIVSPVVTNSVIPNPVVLPNQGVDLALSTHASGRRGLGNPAGVVVGSYQRRPTITGLLDFG